MRFIFRALRRACELLWPDGMETIESTLRGLWVGLWDPAGNWLFAQPAFAVLGILGLLLLLIGRKPQEVVRPRPRRY